MHGKNSVKVYVLWNKLVNPCLKLEGSLLAEIQIQIIPLTAKKVHRRINLWLKQILTKVGENVSHVVFTSPF